MSLAPSSKGSCWLEPRRMRYRTNYLRWTGLLGGGHRVVGVHRESGSTIRVISGSGKASDGARSA